MTEWTPENQPAASIYTEPNRPGSAYNPAISIYGVNPRGAWSGVANYVERDTVTYQGSQWRALRANLNVIPVEGADWTLFASKGADSTMAVGAVTTGAPGTNAIITNSGTASAAIWNFTIPRGDTGAQGPQGIQGPVGPPAGSPLSLISNAAAEIPLTIKGAAGQTANLQEWRNSADSIRGRITAAGNVHWGGDGTDATLDSGSTFHIVARSAGGKPLTVRGAASQTANLQEWQNDAGTVLTRIASSGGMVMPSGSIIGATNSLFTTPSATTTVLQVKGAASQTANLQEWQNSAGGLLAHLTSNAELTLDRRFGDAAARTGSLFSLVRKDNDTGPFLTLNTATTGTVLSVDAGGNLIAKATKVGQGTFFPISGAFHVESRATDDRGVIVRGVAGQTANLAEFQNSSGTVLSGFSAAGYLKVTGNNQSAKQAGSASALPSNPDTYWPIIDANGNTRWVPCYTQP